MLKVSRAELSKIVDWLAEISGHGIYASAAMKQDFKTSVGIEAPNWPEHTWEGTKQIMEARSLGGELPIQRDLMLAYGYEIALSLSLTYAGFVSSKMGRGSSFWDHVNALKNVRDLKVMI